MIESLYAKLGLPDASHLGKRVFKTLFHENATLTATDKAALTDDVETVFWQYTLKPSTIPIQPYADGDREYPEVAVIQIDLKTQSRTSRLNEIIQRAIPYPVWAFFVVESKVAIGVAHKRFHQQQRSQIVAQEILLTDWIDLAAPTPVQADFLNSLVVSSLPFTNFFAFYSGVVDRVFALECGRLSGVFRVESSAAQREVRQRRMAACHQLELTIAEKRAAAKKESQISRLVQLNNDIKGLEAELSRTARELA